MILDKRLRTLGFAGFFCMTAAFSGGASAAQVYPGCAEPGPSPTGKVWWVDPVNGQTPADGGNGSQAAPWNSLQALSVVLAFRPVTRRPLLSTAPYVHFGRQSHLTLADTAGDPPVHPGDTIKLMSGNYGDISMGGFNLEVANSDWVTVKAAPRPDASILDPLHPLDQKMGVRRHYSAKRCRHEWEETTGVGHGIADQGAALPTSDIVFMNLKISSADYATAATWSPAFIWVAHARQVGIFMGLSRQWHERRAKHHLRFYGGQSHFQRPSGQPDYGEQLADCEHRARSFRR